MTGVVQSSDLNFDLDLSSNVNEVIRTVLNSFFTKRFHTHKKHKKHKKALRRNQAKTL